MIFDAFVGPTYQTRLLQTSAEECLNLCPESLESPGARPKVLLRVTPGHAAVISGLNGPIRGQFQQDGRAFCVDTGTGLTHAQLYETTSGAAVALGFVRNDGKPVVIDTNGSQNGAGGHQLIILSAGHGYLYDLNSGAFSEIASAGFPTGAAIGVTFFDSDFLVLTATFVGQSGFEDGSSWNATQRGSREIANDNNVAFINHYPQHTLWVFGSKRTEVWYDNGASTFSYGPIPGVFVNVGCAAAASVQRFNGTIAWLGQDEHGTRSVYLANQYTPQRISSLAIEYLLALCADVSDFVGWVYQEEGHEFYVLTSTANQLTLVYDAKEQLWHRRGYWVNASGSYREVLGANAIISPGGAVWVGGGRTGTIYQMALTLYDDAGNPKRWERRAPHQVAQLRRVYYPGFALLSTQGQGLSSGQGSQPSVALSWSNDGGETFGNEHVRPLGALGQYSTLTRWQMLGDGRNRVFKLTGSDPIPLALLAAYLDPDPVVGTA